MPIIDIIQITPNIDPQRPNGMIADVPDVDGEYQTTDGQTIVVEMNPPGATTTERRIALTCDLFVGHVRWPGYGEPYTGAKRRVVSLSKKNNCGETSLSLYEILRVRLQPK